MHAGSATDLTAKQRLLLDAALAEPDLALQSFRLWWRQVDFAEMRWAEYRLLPLVYHNIGRRIDDPVAAARIRGIAKHLWISNERNAAACTAALDDLIAHGVPTLLLKGAAMMAAVSGGNLRQINDCDIMIPVERAPAALASLLALGHEAPYHALRRFTATDFRSMHAVMLKPAGGLGVPLDIHWRPLSDVAANELAREFFDRSVACRFLGRDTRRPGFEHMLLHAALHGTAWAEQPRYDWLADAIMILRRAGDGFSWRQFTDTANRFGLGAIMRGAIRDLSHLVAVPMPGPGLRLSRGRFLDRVEASWRRADPATLPPAAGIVAAVQAYRRRSPSLAQRPAFAILPEVWRDIAGPPPRSTAAGTTGGDGIVFLRGWSYPEESGRWSNGRLASLAIRRGAEAAGPMLRLVARPMQPAPGRPQAIDVHSGWRRIARLRWPAGDERMRTELLPLPAALRDRDLLMLQFHVRRPAMPPAVRRNFDLDRRRLGLFLSDLGYWPRLRDAAGEPLLLGTEGDHAALGPGWSTPEPEGRWTDGREAVVGWLAPRDARPGTKIVLTAAGLFVPGPDPLTGHIAVNGRRVAELRVPPGAGGPREVALPLPPLDPVDRAIILTIHLDNPRSPRAAGISDDTRRLGLFVTAIRLER